MQVNFHRALLDPKLSRDNFVGESLRDERSHFRFPSRQRFTNTVRGPTICHSGHGVFRSGIMAAHFFAEPPVN